MHRELVANSHNKIVVTGPDHVGCTTLLQLVGKQQGLQISKADRPCIADREDFNQGYFDSLVTRW